MADVLGTDELLVNREGVTYTQEQQTLMANLENDDLLLVNRLGQTYTMTGEDLRNSIVDPLELVVTLAPTDAYTGVEVTAVPFVTGGKVPDGGFVFSYQWYTADDNSGTNKVEIAGETTAKFTPDGTLIDSFFGCEISTTDALGVEASGESFLGPVTSLAGPPVIFDVAVSEIADGIYRYTDKEFPYVTTMALEGEPAPDFELKAKVSGTTFDFTVKSDTIVDVEGGGIHICETDPIDAINDLNYTNGWVSQTGQGDPGAAFDGNVDTSAFYAAGADSNTWVPASPIPFTKLIIYGGTHIASGDGTIEVNGVDVTNQFPTGYMTDPANVGRIDLTNVSGITSPLTSITISARTVGYGFALFGVEVNNSLLISGNTSLEFPTNKGFECFEVGEIVQKPTNWQNGTWVIYGTGNPYQDPSGPLDWNYTFDGASSPDYVPGTSSGGNTFPAAGETMTWQPPTPLTVTQQVDIYCYNRTLYTGSTPGPDPSITYGLRVNGTIWLPDTPSYGTKVTIPAATINGQLEKVELIQDGALGGPYCSGIAVDGIFLVDPSAVDGSSPSVSTIINKEPDANPPTITVEGGQWRPGNTNPIYSDDLISPSGTPGDAFDGDPTTECLTSTNTAVYDRVFTDVSYMRIRTRRSNFTNPNLKRMPISGPGIQDGFELQANEVMELTNIPLTSTTVGPISITGVSGQLGSGIAQLEINGVVLVDGLPGDDKLSKETAYDTKLTVASSSNLSLLEGDVVMDDGSTVNATQTPYKLVTTDIESVSDYTSWKQDRVWSSQLTSSTGAWYSGRTQEGAFDGALDNWANPSTGNGSFLTWTPIPAVDYSESVEIYTKGNGVHSLNGGTDVAHVMNEWVTIATGSGTINTLVVTGDNYPAWAAVRVDGQILVDDGVDGAPVLGKELTFPGDVSTNPDLQYFLPGDELIAASQQTVSGTSDAMVGSSNSSILLNGTAPAYSGTDLTSSQTQYLGHGNSNGPSELIVFDPPITDPNNNIHLNCFLQPNAGTITVNVGQPGQLTLNKTKNSTWGYQTIGSKTLYNFRFDGRTSTSAVLAGVQFATTTADASGRITSDTLSDDAVTVVSVDTTNNTMVVDGGNWGTGDDEVWSETTTIAYTGNAASGNSTVYEQVFNGDTSDGYYVIGTGSTPSLVYTITFAEPIRGSVVRVYTGGDAGAGAAVNASDAATLISTPQYSWTTIYDGAEIDISSIALGALTGSQDNITNAIEIDGEILIDADSNAKTFVEYQTDGGTGTVISTNSNDNTILLTDTGTNNERWIGINNGEGTGVSKDFTAAPVAGIAVQQDYAWCKMQIVNDKAQVTGIQGTEPAFLPVTSKDYSIKFPAVFPTGNTPDEDLPRGVCIAAIVAAENASGRSEKESNCFMPADVIGEGVAGPITDSTSSTLTVGSTANLDTFSGGDNLVMCDINGELAEYTMRTTDIQSVGEESTWNQDHIWGTGLSSGSYGGTVGPFGGIAGGYLVSSNGVGITWNAASFNLKAKTFTVNCSGTHSVTTNVKTYNRASGTGNEDYTYVFDGEETIQSFSTPAIGGSGQIMSSPVMADGKWLVNEGVAGAPQQTLLTFPGDVSTNPDLKFFKPGDAVLDYKIWSSYGNGKYNGAYPQTLLFDGNVTQYNNCVVPNTTDSFVWYYPEGIPFTSIEIAGVGRDQEVYINDLKVQNTNAFNIWQTNAQCVTIVPTFTGNIGNKLYKIELPKWQTGAALAGIKLDGQWLVDDSRTPVKVVSTGWPDSNTMVVDGGNWSGATNTDSVWSSFMTNTDPDGYYPGSGSDKAFNGLLTDSASTKGVGSGDLVVTFPAGSRPTATSKVEVYTNSSATASATLETTGGVSVEQDFDSSTGWVEVADADKLGELLTLTISKSATLSAVRVDGELLVDPVNDSEIWSANSSYTGSAPAADQAADKGFNGSTSYTDGYFYAVNGGTQTVLFNDLEFTKLEFWTWNHQLVNGELTANGVSLTQAIADDPNTVDFFDGGFKFDATALVTSPLTNITASKLANPTSAGFTAVYVDGKMLVDTGAVEEGMRFAEFGPVSGTADFVSTDGTSEVNLLNSNDRWIDSSNRLGENFYFRDIITVLNADNPKHVALQQEIAAAFAAFPEKVNERRTAIASSFYRLMGGEQLTTAEFELLEETVTNAVNATEPFALDGYYPLYYTSAKADAASSLDSHHTHNINGIDYYMPDGGTLYHGNYITPD